MTDDEKVEGNRGQVIITFTLDDTLSAEFKDMKPWKLWAAASMVKALGDQMFMQSQMDQMQRQQQEAATRNALLQSLTSQPGGLRGPQS